MDRQASPQAGIGLRHPHYHELLELAPAPDRPAPDFIEVHSENFFGEGGAALAVLARARERYPVSLHGVGLALGSAAGVDAWHLEQLARLVERIEPVRVSDHACFARAPLGGAVVHAGDLLPLPFNRAALGVLCANVQRVQERLRRTVAVENLSAYIEFTGGEYGEAEFLAELARRSGCLLLVDVNNIYVNALNAQRAGADADPEAACRRWLDRIAPEAVAEIHLAGHCVLHDIVIDDHGSRVGEPVWRLYRHAVQRFGPVPTLIEWDTAIPPLEVLLREAGQARSMAAQRLPQEALA